MSRVPYVEKLNNMYQESGFPPYKWSVFDSSPWTPLVKPLEECCIALLSSAGISLDNQEPFDSWAVNDLSFRKIPKDTPSGRLRLHHNYFDHRDALQDINCIFPMERLLELEQEGTIGKLAPLAITLGMGRLYKRTALQQETVPQIVNVLREQETDAVILVAAWPLDHQSVGLIARTIEEEGIPTVFIGSCRDMMMQVKPPRAVFIDFPLGRQCGKPGDVALQKNILLDALDVLVNADTPGTLVGLSYQWGEPFSWESYQKDVEEMVEEKGGEMQAWVPKK